MEVAAVHLSGSGVLPSRACVKQRDICINSDRDFCKVFYKEAGAGKTKNRFDPSFKDEGGCKIRALTQRRKLALIINKLDLYF